MVRHRSARETRPADAHNWAIGEPSACAYRVVRELLLSGDVLCTLPSPLLPQLSVACQLV